MVKDIVLSSLLHLVRPTVRLCLKHGIKLGEVVDTLKRVYVSQAEEILVRDGDSVSTSRITLMTGVHRTDVAAIRTEGRFEPREKHTASDVISQWRYNARFCSRPGQPRALTFDSKTSEFAKLVNSVSHSVSPYTVAFELERLGMLKRTRDGKIKLLTRVYVPKGDPTAILTMLGSDADDLYSAVEENAFRREDEGPPHHHLKTEYRNIPRQALPEITKWCMREGSAFHERARNFLSKFDRDIHPNVPGEGTCRVALGSFSFTEEVQKPDPELSSSNDRAQGE